RAQVEGFGLVRAFPDQGRDSLAIALEFSRPLVGTQDFDKLVTFAEPMAEPSSWSLDDSGKVLRYPHVKPNQTFTLRISGDLTAADGSKIGKDIEQQVFTADHEPAAGFASQVRVHPAQESRGQSVSSLHV